MGEILTGTFGEDPSDKSSADIEQNGHDDEEQKNRRKEGHEIALLQVAMVDTKRPRHVGQKCGLTSGHCA
jgi:hypothetical protein